MKTANANKFRAKAIEAIMAYFVEANEDCGMIASNSFNFPIEKDGEEGWVEIVVKVPKYGDDEGYALREEYVMKCEKRAQKEQEQAEAKARKIARDEEKRRAKAEAKASMSLDFPARLTPVMILISGVPTKDFNSER